MIRSFWMYVNLVAVLIAGTISSGCIKDIGSTVGNIGSTVEQTVKGDYYLKSRKYEQGRESFKAEVLESPNSALAHYYYGRFLLQAGDEKEALKELKRARDLDPANADYFFWTGVAYGGNGNKALEVKQYQAALRLEQKHLQALIYLGHSQLESKDYKEALETYNRALAIWPGSPSSLYNRALILRRLGRTPEEKVALHEYLARYPTGAMARRATAHLNAIGDFTYRNHHLGARTATIEKIWFVPLTAELSPASEDSLDLIGSVIKNMQNGTLQVVFYQKNNPVLAKKRAVAIKRYLEKEFPGLGRRGIGVSWFGEPQVITVEKKKQKIDESASFFTSMR